MEIKISDERSLYLKESCSISSMSELIKEINKINQEDEENINFLKMRYNIEYTPKPISLYINTYRGDVYATFGLIDAILTSQTPVNTICTGLASSCGLLVLLAGKERIGYKNSSYLLHTISNIAFGDLQTLEDDVVENQRLHKQIVKHIITNTNITQKEIEEVKKLKKDFFMDSILALEKGIITNII
jgi:ATP-dependent Clp protease protease subunit